MNDPELVPTSDGSCTLRTPKYGVTYHSIHGAIQESLHVFISAGLESLIPRESIKVFEMGLGTGLNLMLTLKRLEGESCNLIYHAVDSHPLPLDTTERLNYPETLARPGFNEINHRIASSENPVHFTYNDQAVIVFFKQSIQDVELDGDYQLVFYDAFAPTAQPELWDIPVLTQVRNAMCEQGVLVTYCAQGQFKRNLRSLGFEVESMAGPPGKREMVRARLISKPG